MIYSVTALLITVSPATAEVCDKERPNWNYADGPVSQLKDLWLFLASPFGVGLIIILLIALYVKNAWVSGFVIATLVAIVWLIGSTWLEFDHITRAAVREGCIASPVAGISMMILASVVLIFVTFRHPKRGS